MELTKEIQESITKNLPSMVAGELQSYLKTAEHNKEELAQAKVNLQNRDKEIAQLKYEKNTWENVKTLRIELAKRQEILEERERDIKVTLAEAKINAAEGTLKAIYDLTSIVFRSPTKVTSINGTEAVSVTPNNTCSGYATSQPVTKTITESEQ